MADHGPTETVPRVVADAVVAWADLAEPLHACGGSNEEWKSVGEAWNVIGDAVRTYASRVVASIPLTVGAALGDPRVQVTDNVIDCGTAQLRVQGGRVVGRTWFEGRWGRWLTASMEAITYAQPCRIVPFAGCDAPPAALAPPAPAGEGGER